MMDATLPCPTTKPAPNGRLRGHGEMERAHICGASRLTFNTNSILMAD